MGKRTNRPAPPYYEQFDTSDTSEDGEMNLPRTESSPSLWSVIKNQSTHIIRLQTANDRLICRLLAMGEVDEDELFNDNEEDQVDAEESEFESNPELIILTAQNRQIANFQRRNDELTEMLSIQEQEHEKSQQLGVETPTTRALFDLFGCLSDLTSKSEDETDSSVDDPINKPRPCTSTGITHPKPKKKKHTSKRKFCDDSSSSGSNLLESLSDVHSRGISQDTLVDETNNNFHPHKKQKCEPSSSDDTDDEFCSNVAAVVEPSMQCETDTSSGAEADDEESSSDTEVDDSFEVELEDDGSLGMYNQETMVVSSEVESVERQRQFGSSNHSRLVYRGLDGNFERNTDDNNGRSIAVENQSNPATNDDTMENETDYNMNNNMNNNLNNKEDDSPDTSFDPAPIR